ncbi:MAG TPA: hypothetical protein VIS73_09955 [Rhodocyclaceae bacterium]
MKRLHNAIIVLFSAASLLAAGPALAEVPKPSVEIAQPDTQCVAPPEEMRRNHMAMLTHQRDRTLRLGERGAPITLNGCINCHASKASGSVAGAKGDFCAGCHAYAAVKLDCFECHQPKASLASLSKEMPR